MANDETPLLSSSAQDEGGGVDPEHQIARRMKDLFSNENIGKAGLVAKSRFKELSNSVKSGNWSIRLLALASGLALVVAASLGILSNFFTFHLLSALMEVYALILGLIILILECQQFGELGEKYSFLTDFMQRVFKYALFLKFVWGRGILYFVAGSLQFAQGSYMDMGIGGFVMLVGILFVIVGHQTAAKLKDLRESLVSEQALRSKFRQADTNNSGSLTLDEFQSLMVNLQLNVSRRETEAAFMHLDKSGNNEVSFDEFKAWWTDFDTSADVGRTIV